MILLGVSRKRIVNRKQGEITWIRESSFFPYYVRSEDFMDFGEHEKRENYELENMSCTCGDLLSWKLILMSQNPHLSKTILSTSERSVGADLSVHATTYYCHFENLIDVCCKVSCSSSRTIMNVLALFFSLLCLQNSTDMIQWESKVCSSLSKRQLNLLM